MKNLHQLQQLATDHGVKTTKRVFFDSVDPLTRKPTPQFLDLQRPASELHAELVAKGVLPATP